MAKTFPVGSKVAWAQRIAHMHSDKSVLIKSTVLSVDPTAVFGEVVGHDQVGWPVVKLEDGTEQMLTNDELVRVEEA